jgi:hypothetical protein
MKHIDDSHGFVSLYGWECINDQSINQSINSDVMGGCEYYDIQESHDGGEVASSSLVSVKSDTVETTSNISLDCRRMCWIQNALPFGMRSIVSLNN